VIDQPVSNSSEQLATEARSLEGRASEAEVAMPTSDGATELEAQRETTTSKQERLMVTN